MEQVVGALTRLGKAAVVVGDGPGFVANRIQFAMFREAARIVEDGLATPEQVDEVVRSSFGFRLPFFGPFTIADMAGLDVYADIYETLERGLGAGFSAPESCASTSPAATSASRPGAGSSSCRRPRRTSSSRGAIARTPGSRGSGGRSRRDAAAPCSRRSGSTAGTRS